MSAPLPPIPPHAIAQLEEADLERIYSELRGHARALLAAERPGHSLEATALVHEAVAKLLCELDARSAPLPLPAAAAERRRMLFAMLFLRMRQVLVEHARHRKALKRPGRWHRSALSDSMAAVVRDGIDLLDLDQALSELQRIDPEAGAVFEHRWFGGLSMASVALVLDIEAEEAQRRWTRARRVLRRIIGEAGSSG